MLCNFHRLLLFVVVLTAPLFAGGLSLSAQSSDPPPEETVTVAIDFNLPERYFSRLLTGLIRTNRLDVGGTEARLLLLDRTAFADVAIRLSAGRGPADTQIALRYYAPVVPFASIQDAIESESLRARWQGEGGPLLIPSQDRIELETFFGAPPTGTVLITDTERILPLIEADPNAVAILPFEMLDPRVKVLAIDGLNLLDNRLVEADYPLVVSVVAEGEAGSDVAKLLRSRLPISTNRDSSRLTTLLMTGVTAMSRVTAARMETYGPLYPAMVISDTLRAADITHISNEVPFLDDCRVNAAANNLILCSHTDYWAALEALGTDIVGLSGNHVNDFGRDGARRSINWYRENEIPIYGSGLNLEEACDPLLWEHNGNKFAFIAALAFQPSFAWATEELPGACYYYSNKEMLFNQVRELRPEVDVIAFELQYLETYNPYPTAQQVIEFRELRDVGVDIVTGVQSHVPQAMEPYGRQDPGGAGIIVYGLGNFFFDQMWSWQTRTELMARHTIYNGQILNTEILTAVLEDWAQPRWATETERANILGRIFAAAPRRP